MSLLSVIGLSGLSILALMTLLYVISLAIRNASIVDIFWGSGFVIVNAVAFFLTPDGAMPRKLLLVTLVTLWGLRLTLHILFRNVGKPEDFRYQKWREEHGKNWWWRSYFQVFILQGLLMWIISIPLIVTQHSSAPAGLIWLDYLAILIWTYGFFFEATGDYQLTKFKSNPENKGKVLNFGVWRFSRHPNYFGDSAQWWGYYMIALTAGGFWTIFSPVIMTLLLLKVSGVALLEKSLTETKPQYAEYIQSTSSFIPWFPKKVITVETKGKENEDR